MIQKQPPRGLTVSASSRKLSWVSTSRLILRTFSNAYTLMQTLPNSSTSRSRRAQNSDCHVGIVAGVGSVRRRDLYTNAAAAFVGWSAGPGFGSGECECECGRRGVGDPIKRRTRSARTFSTDSISMRLAGQGAEKKAAARACTHTFLTDQFRQRGHVERGGDSVGDEFVAEVAEQVFDEGGEDRQVVRGLERRGEERLVLREVVAVRGAGRISPSSVFWSSVREERQEHASGQKSTNAATWCRRMGGTRAQKKKLTRVSSPR